MEIYLKKLHKINQKIKDPAEFWNFIDSAKAFINRAENCENQDLFVNSLRKALKLKNKTLVAQTIYEIASELKVNQSFVAIKTLKRDFKRSEVRSSVMKYLLKFEIKEFDHKIKKKLDKGKLRIDKNVLNYIKCNVEIAKDFMFNQDNENVFIQLDLIIESQVFYNISYFVQFLGSESRFLCFKAYEALNKFFECIETNEKDLNTSYDSHAYSQVLEFIGSESLSLALKENSLKIFNLQNFIIFAHSFLKERDEIIKMVKESDMNGLLNIVSHYFSNVERRYLDIKESDLCKRSKTNIPVLIRHEDNESFAYLFRKKYRKDICDCYEF